MRPTMKQKKAVQEKPVASESDEFSDEHEESETDDKKTDPESVDEDDEVVDTASPPPKTDDKKTKPEVTKKVNEAAKKDNEALKTAVSHPTYAVMVLDAVGESGKNGNSRAKIVQFMKSKYKLDEISSSALKKAMKTLEEKEQIVHKTGVGMTGSFTLTKKQKLIQTKEKLKAAKLDGAVTEKDKIKTQPKKQVKKSKDDLELLKQKKQKKGSKDDLDLLKKKKVTAKKPPIPKGKENKVANKKDGTRKPQILQAKIKALSKASSTGDLRKGSAVDGPSTSKKGMAQGKKSPVAKKAKRAK